MYVLLGNVKSFFAKPVCNLDLMENMLVLYYHLLLVIEAQST